METNLVTIDRPRFRLEVWRERTGYYTRKFKFPIAVGKLGFRTPPGAYMTTAKSRTPDWKAPDSEWVPIEMRGKFYSIDSPENPFAGGFISLSGGEGIGIHGTKFDPEVGTRASHGCIRMHVSDLLKLWDDVPIGTTVVIF